MRTAATRCYKFIKAMRGDKNIDQFIIHTHTHTSHTAIRLSQFSKCHILYNNRWDGCACAPLQYSNLNGLYFIFSDDDNNCS